MHNFFKLLQVKRINKKKNKKYIFSEKIAGSGEYYKVLDERFITIDGEHGLNLSPLAKNTLLLLISFKY
jgi:hypothetical protein